MDFNEIEAAIYMKMSPKLMKWFSKYAPKYNDNRKLAVAKEENGILFYSKSELDEFNRYLLQSWPNRDGNRPTVPIGIQKEIKGESGGKCAICGADLGEFAHIDPVYNSKNNHPHNLIYLCPNCHTKYDINKIYSVKEIKEIKEEILRSRVILWKSQSDLINSIIALTVQLRSIRENEKYSSISIYNELNNQVIEGIKQAVLIDSSEMNSNIPRYRDKEKYNELKNQINDVLLKHEDVEAKIIQTSEEYLEKSNEALCPLCKGSGMHNNWECPICSGVGTVEIEALDEIDLTPYEQEECPLCKGSGMHNNWECPICRGAGTVDIEALDEIDLIPYEQEKCPLCKGSGMHNNWKCPICRGAGTVDIEALDEIDLTLYEQEECPLCKGSGMHNNLGCPICRGAGTVDIGALDEVDLTPYEQEECPLCKGSGMHNNLECPLCRGAGTVDIGALDEIDLTEFD